MKPITDLVLKTIRYDEKLTLNFLKYNTMKKVLSIIALSVMTLILSSFNTHTTNQIVAQEDCDESYNELYDFAISNGASDRVAKLQAGQYWADCVIDGGRSDFLNAIIAAAPFR